MMKKVGNLYAVESDQGFVVTRTGSPLTQFIMHYQEGSKSLNYPLENLIPGSETPIAVKLIKNWNSPHSMDPLPLNKRVEIAERIKEAMQFLGDKSFVIE